MNKIKYLTSLCILSLIVSGCAEKELPKFSDTNESVMQSSVYQKEDLEIYIPIEYINIPDLHNDIYTDPTELRRKCANKVIFDTKEFENYTIELVGNTVMRDTSIDSNIIFSYYLDIRLNYYDEKKDQTPAYANSVNMGQGAYKLVADKLDKYITLYEMHTSSGIYPLIIFQYFNESSIGETTFYSIIDEQLFFFHNSLDEIEEDSAISIKMSKDVEIDEESCSIIDNEFKIKYVFDFENQLVKARYL